MSPSIPRLPALARAALLCALAATPAGPVAVASTHTLSVGATVLSKNKCLFTNNGPTALAFGAIDPSVAVNNTATATTTFACRGSDPMATYNITSNDGLYKTGAGAPRMRHATDHTKFLPYSLNLPQSATVPKNTTQTLTVTGTIVPSDFQNALGGAYSDTVILTIDP